MPKFIRNIANIGQIVTSPRFNFLYLLTFLVTFGFPDMGLSEPKAFYSTFDTISKEMSKHPYTQNLNGTNEVCKKYYNKLYDRDTLRIGIYLGLMNKSDGSLIDRPAKYALVNYFTKECSSGHHACGFSQTKSDLTVLQKETNNSQKIIINISDTSINDQLTVNDPKSEIRQRTKSNITKNKFLDSLGKDDILFYIGHSRYGTGPGFDYPVRAFSFKWFSRLLFPTTLSATIRSLEQTSTPPKLLGIFGCNSQRYFAKKINAAAPGTALLVSSGLTFFEPSVVEVAHTINSILGNLCYTDKNGVPIKIHPTGVHKLYGIFPTNTFPEFINNNLLSIISIILTLPFLAAFLSKNYKASEITLFSKISYPGHVALLLGIPIASAALIKLIYLHFDSVKELAIPIFIIFSGFLFLLIFFQKLNKFPDIVRKISKAAALPILFSLIVLFAFNWVSEPNFNQLSIAVTQSMKFVVIFYCFLPFFIFSTGILKYPLWGTIKINFISRIVIFVVFSNCFYIIIVFSVIYLNVDLLPEKDILLFFFFFNQVISLLLYFIRENIVFPIVFQTLTVTVLIAGNVHGLFY